MRSGRRLFFSSSLLLLLLAALPPLGQAAPPAATTAAPPDEAPAPEKPDNDNRNKEVKICVPPKAVVAFFVAYGCALVGLYVYGGKQWIALMEAKYKLRKHMALELALIHYDEYCERHGLHGRAELFVPASNEGFFLDAAVQDAWLSNNNLRKRVEKVPPEDFEHIIRKNWDIVRRAKERAFKLKKEKKGNAFRGKPGDSALPQLNLETFVPKLREAELVKPQNPPENQDDAAVGGLQPESEGAANKKEQPEQQPPSETKDGDETKKNTKTSGDPTKDASEQKKTKDDEKKKNTKTSGDPTKDASEQKKTKEDDKKKEKTKEDKEKTKEDDKKKEKTKEDKEKTVEKKDDEKKKDKTKEEKEKTVDKEEKKKESEKKTKEKKEEKKEEKMEAKKATKKADSPILKEARDKSPTAKEAKKK